jgi:DNA processing protein
MKDQVAILQLMQTKGVGRRTLERALSKLGQDGRTPADLVVASVDELSQFGLKPDTARALASGRNSAERLAEELNRRGIQMLVRGTAGYPARLNLVLANQAPPVLFVAGNLALLERKGVAFCGARHASEEGLRLTQEVARHLAERRVNVVSGHAHGVDLTAHVAALAGGGTTALVLPEGILRFQAKPALAELLGDDNVVVVSEFSPRLPWSVGNAIQRNATVCGLADVVLVIEAGQTGGTYAAGQMALKLHQPMFVVAFPQPPESAAGNALLLRQGAQPLRCEAGDEPDLSGVFQALERNTESKVGHRRTGVQPAIVQGGLFNDTREPEGLPSPGGSST